MRFLCECRVSGMPYVGVGNSTNKKDAEKNAARDFVNFLVRTGQLNASDVPANALEQGGALPARMATVTESVPMFQVCIHEYFRFSIETVLIQLICCSLVKGQKMLAKPIVE